MAAGPAFWQGSLAVASPTIKPNGVRLHISLGLVIGIRTKGLRGMLSNDPEACCCRLYDYSILRCLLHIGLHVMCIECHPFDLIQMHFPRLPTDWPFCSSFV